MITKRDAIALFLYIPSMLGAGYVLQEHNERPVKPVSIPIRYELEFEIGPELMLIPNSPVDMYGEDDRTFVA
ncbi:hypothetical protein CMI46_02170 [Candidatus Pacearchaeota archaeon]|nr:hypothetical protein [Candidatus Pacearchaeota archaeon]|tara:strand:+ start:4968 stop:5183 length:216 start_codon:yes stop_codon:yes gene_type:complete